MDLSFIPEPFRMILIGGIGIIGTFSFLKFAIIKTFRIEDKIFNQFQYYLKHNPDVVKFIFELDTEFTTNISNIGKKIYKINDVFLYIDGYELEAKAGFNPIILKYSATCFRAQWKSVKSLFDNIANVEESSKELTTNIIFPGSWSAMLAKTTTLTDEHVKNAELSMGWLLPKHEFQKLNKDSKNGIFLVGEPGTGKSTLIKTLSILWKVHIYYIVIGKDSDDKSFIESLSNMPTNQRKLIVFEDFDRIYDHNVPIPEQCHLNMSTILNAIDGGLFNKTNSIFIMSVNDPTNVTKSLRRFGRFGTEINVNHLDSEQAIAFSNHFNVDPKMVEGKSLSEAMDICDKTLVIDA